MAQFSDSRSDGGSPSFAHLELEREREHLQARVTGLEFANARLQQALDTSESLRAEAERQLMGYAGMVSREHSSGTRIQRGSISKAGNAHLRRIVTEAAWSYRHLPALGSALRARQSGASAEVKAIAWRAQHRLHGRYRSLLGKGKIKQKVITALGRELLGFIWAIGCEIERTHSQEVRRAA